jgi:RNase adapter protein RapZ
LTDGIARERELLRDLRGDADLVLDTSTLNVHELRAKIVAAFGDRSATALHATVVSFGYKYGLPVDADVVVDCRLLPNPHWVAELRPRTGLDDDVRDYVLAQEGAQEFVAEWAALLRRYEKGYLHEGKHFATIAVGCTGGKHRSVVIAEQLAERLQLDGVDVRVVHRDLGRE